MGWWMPHSRESRLLWELDRRRKRGHVAQGSGCLSTGAERLRPQRTRTSSMCGRLGRLHILAADLKIESVRILYVKTVVGVGLGIKAAAI
jgi:hypothetical protein